MKKTLLLILDGFGIRKDKHGNAIALANKPNIDYLFNKYKHSLLDASGESVGLPEGQMGNSEVGHLNIGAGRIIYTGLSIINNDIKKHLFEKNIAFLNAINHAKKNKSKLHIIGLMSNGGIHSMFTHFENLIKLVKKEDIQCVIHCITDGRDTSPKSFLTDYYPTIKHMLNDKIVLGTISGRFYTMDRDKNWDRVEYSYKTMYGLTNHTFNDVEEYVNNEFNKGVKGDEFITPALNNNIEKEKIILDNNDSIIFFNYRPDRAREISHLIYGSNYYSYESSKKINNLYFVTMMKYEGIEPSMVAYPPLKYKNVLGEVIANNNLSQLRISETEKYAHVTFFFDGGEEIEYKNEKKIIIESPKVQTYDLCPEMSSEKITNELLSNINKFDITICNFPNCDMVGHTGDLDATIKAVEAVDKCVGKIYEFAKKNDITLFICADHGNADMVLDENSKPHTAHTTNMVPFLITDENNKHIKNGKLANIAPTLLKYMGINIPSEMDEEPLI